MHQLLRFHERTLTRYVPPAWTIVRLRTDVNGKVDDIQVWQRFSARTVNKVPAPFQNQRVPFSTALLEAPTPKDRARLLGKYERRGKQMIKIGVVDDHAIVRSGLRQFFSGYVDLRVTGEAASGREAIELVCTTELDVLVMDLAMPGQSGIHVLAMIHAKAPNVGILILSGYPEEHYAMNLIRQGASGYLNKECDPMEIVNAVRVISLGRHYITPGVAELLARQLDRKDDVAPHKRLSEREFQVFLKLAKGETAGDIAKNLSLSVKTVSTYRTRLTEKMNLSSNSDLTYYALKNELID